MPVINKLYGVKNKNVTFSHRYQDAMLRTVMLYGDLTCGGSLLLAIQNVNCYTQPTLHNTHLQEKRKNSGLITFTGNEEERTQTTASILLGKQHIWICKSACTLTIA
jgi:hypothetical protein